MKILIWCPHISFGGGIRLLQQLAPAIARHPGVEFVRLAVLASARLGGETRSVSELFSGLEVFELTAKREEEGGHATFRAWLESEGRVLGIRGTGRLKAVASRLLPRPADAQPEVPWEYEQLERAAEGCDVIYCFWPHHVACPTLDKPIACTYQDTTLIDFPEILDVRMSSSEKTSGR